jgi:hypothetical protein
MQYYCAKQGEFAVSICFEVFFSFFMHPEVVIMLMSCSLCEPESRADGALAAQEWNQLTNAVAEASVTPANLRRPVVLVVPNAMPSAMPITAISNAAVITHILMVARRRSRRTTAI